MSQALPSLLAADTPAAVKAEMLNLRAELDKTVPPKRDAPRNLLIGTWNLKQFASVREKWTASDNDNPKRDWRGLWAITEIVQRFDVVALQEVKGDLKALRTMLKTLGSDWQFLMTDVTRGAAGNQERLAFLFDSRRIALSGLACELVVPEEQLAAIAPDALTRQFARTPYAVGFRAGAETFVLVALHVDYGENADEREPELKKIAEWMDDWAGQLSAWEQNLIVLGDFNIDRRGSPLWEAFVSTGLMVPPQLELVPRSIFQTDVHRLDKYYDQIAWFDTGTKRKLNLQYLHGGGFDFVPHLYGDIGLNKTKMQHRVSDHYPLWVEFACRS
jgi:endonuclease/exonuclease/phosphatase family metal-dependent hydrolase